MSIVRKTRKPRKADTYRGARRMAAKKAKALKQWRAKNPGTIIHANNLSKKYPYASRKRGGLQQEMAA